MYLHLVIGMNRKILVAFAAAILIVSTTVYLFQANVTSLNAHIADLQSQVGSLNSQIATLQSQASSDKSTIATANSQLDSLSSSVTTLQSQISGITEIINISNSQLETLVFHVCEKGEGYTWGHIPDANYTYKQILALSNRTYNILLLPEYKGHTNWTEELSWLATHFGGHDGIPIMLDVFGGGDNPTPTPMLSASDILAAMATCNVKYLRFSEVLSWHLEHPAMPFPTSYVASILELCRANGL